MTNVDNRCNNRAILTIDRIQELPTVFVIGVLLFLRPCIHRRAHVDLTFVFIFTNFDETVAVQCLKLEAQEKVYTQIRRDVLSRKVRAGRYPQSLVGPDQ